jgi:hypothetical protein
VRSLNVRVNLITTSHKLQCKAHLNVRVNVITTSHKLQCKAHLNVRVNLITTSHKLQCKAHLNVRVNVITTTTLTPHQVLLTVVRHILYIMNLHVTVQKILHLRHCSGVLSNCVIQFRKYYILGTAVEFEVIVSYSS